MVGHRLGRDDTAHRDDKAGKYPETFHLTLACGCRESPSATTTPPTTTGEPTTSAAFHSPETGIAVIHTTIGRFLSPLPLLLHCAIALLSRRVVTLSFQLLLQILVDTFLTPRLLLHDFPSLLVGQTLQTGRLIRGSHADARQHCSA
jgi:hypothetical protein